MDGVVPLLATAAAVLGAALVGRIYWKVLRPARLLRGALLSLADENERSGTVALTVARQLAQAAGPLAACAEPLERLASRLREMDRQLHDESVNLQTILGGLSEGVLVVDRSHKVRSVNDGLRRMFDLRTSPLNRSLLEVFRHHDVQAAVLEALDGGDSRTRPLTLATRREDGRYAEKHFDLTAAGLLPRGAERPVGAIAIFHDVTRLRALESVRQEFVANVSHELRTPLSIINGYLETLLEEGALEDHATAGRFLRVMAKHGHRLNLLVEDLLTLSELERTPAAAGNDLEPIGPLHRNTLELRPCLERVVERLAPVAAERGITIALDVAPGTLHVDADGHRLDQALFNLLDNALKYGVPATLPEITVHAGLAEDDPDWVEIAVTDHGPGIPLADQGHIFERFYRVHKDRSREAGGTGLGLSIVKHILQAHGGTVAVNSRPGHGATFRLRLPAVPDGADAEVEELSLSETGVGTA